MKIIRKFTFVIFTVLVTLITFFLSTGNTQTKPAQPTGKPIVIGLVTVLKFQCGIGAVRAAELAVEEINAAGGVNVAGVRHPLKLESADGRCTEPGTPINETLMVIEKLILDKGIRFFVGGPNRSEAALAALDLFSKYKAINI